MKLFSTCSPMKTVSGITEINGYWLILFSIYLAGHPALAMGRGILEVDPQNGAATLRVPLGPGVGRPGLRFIPALIGRFAPMVGVAPPGPGIEPVDQTPVLRGTTGFELSPGTLEVWLDSGEGTVRLPGARWTFPDGSGGSTRGEMAPGVSAQNQLMW